jgi:hypothetical protein
VPGENGLIDHVSTKMIPCYWEAMVLKGILILHFIEIDFNVKHTIFIICVRRTT